MSGWANDILAFWFEELETAQWWKKDSAVDAEIGARFGALWETSRQKPADDFLTDPDIARAAIILFDQFPRNMFRDDPRAFVTDPLARVIATAAVEAEYDDGLSVHQRQFLYMPFMHSEDLGDQQRSLSLFAGLDDEGLMGFAQRHYDVVAKFGRFPHRNTVLGRTSTLEEIAAVEAGAAW